MMPPAYANWQTRIYCGATPAFPTARLKAMGHCCLPRERWPDLLDTSITVVGQLVRARPELELLSQAKPSAKLATNPLLAWLKALLSHLEVPDYPLRVITGEGGDVRIDIACPYPEAANSALVVAITLLNLSNQVLVNKQATLEVGPLLQEVTRLPLLLPDPPVMAMHAALSGQGTDWEWLGGALTRVGQGRRQRLCFGFNDSSTSLAGAAAIQNDAARYLLLRAAGLGAPKMKGAPRNAFDLLIVAGRLSAVVAKYSDGKEPERIQGIMATHSALNVHPQLSVACERAFRIFGMPLLAVKYHAESLAEAPGTALGEFSEVSHSPDLKIFVADIDGYRSLVAGVVAALFPRDELRVPIYTVTGSVGKTTTVRLLGQLLATCGLRVGLTTSDGAWIGEHRWLEGDCIGGVSAQAILRHIDVDVAVLEQGRGGMIKQGIPFTHSDVAVLLNVQAVHLGLDGIDTLEAMADTKALSLMRAKLAVLNYDDVQCRRLGEQRAPESCVWFSMIATEDALCRLSQTAWGAIGVLRGPADEPLELEIWQCGTRVRQLPLIGVAPFHGTLGEKTLEELLAAVAAAWFGPVALPDWDTALPRLQLNSDNHLFRCSVHRQGNIVFVLDKAAEASSLSALETVINEICRGERIDRRIGVLTRSAGDHPYRHQESCVCLHRFLDEFICFDQMDTYESEAALPSYSPGSIPLILQQELLRLNEKHGIDKPIRLFDGWEAAATYLSSSLQLDGLKILVLINQPGTSVVELNRKIVDFVLGFCPSMAVNR